jgi:nuclear pore complex protein Nup155
VDQPDVISSVAVVKPKSGVFIDEISFLLVICTPISVLLIGLSSTSTPGPNNRGHKEIKLYATDMTVSTEIEMTSVVGTKDGRILMCGSQDGNLYELHYQEKEGWFGKRMQLINHSVGSVQSLFPRFSSPSSEGLYFSMNNCISTQSLLQVGLCRLFLTRRGTASTH